MEEKEYIVAVCGEFEDDIQVMATSKEQAIEKAQQLFQRNICENEFCALTWWDINSYEAFEERKK